MKRRIMSMFMTVAMVLTMAPYIAPKAEAVQEVYGAEINTFSANYDTAAAIVEDGGLYTWGDGGYGQIGNGAKTDQNLPVRVLENATSVSVGNQYIAAVTSDGSLYTWGGNWSGQLGLGHRNDVSVPSKVSTLSNVVSVVAGTGITAAITRDRSLYVWGTHYLGRVENGSTTEQILVPVKVLNNVKSVELGSGHIAALTYDEHLYVWGLNRNGQVGNGTNEDQLWPQLIMRDVKSFSTGECSTAAITNSGDLFVWGKNLYGAVGNGENNTNQLEPIKILSDVKSVELSSFHSAAIMNNGDLYCWGHNDYGQVGISSEQSDQLRPVKVLSSVSKVALGIKCSSAIQYDGTEARVYTWGNNGRGQLGLNDTIDRHYPEEVSFENNEMEILDITMCGFDGNNCFVLDSAGTLYGWGEGYDGQVGHGLNRNQLSPVAILGDVRLPQEQYYTVTFDLNDGSGEKVTQIVSKDDPITLPETGEREGYTFQGWYGNPDLKGASWIGRRPSYSSNNLYLKDLYPALEKTEPKPGWKLNIPLNITLYAEWKASQDIEYGVDTFNFENGDWGCKLPDEYYDFLIEDLAPHEIIGINNYTDTYSTVGGGQCYGMAAVLALVKAGRIHVDFFQPSANCVNDFDHPDKSEQVKNLLSFYWLTQCTDAINDERLENLDIPQEKLREKLMVSIYTSNYPVILSFSYVNKIDLPGFYEEYPGNHSVLAYGFEKNNDVYDIKIWDPNNKKKFEVLHISEDYSSAWFKKDGLYDNLVLTNILTIESGLINIKDLENELNNPNTTSTPTLFNLGRKEVEETITLSSNYDSFLVTNSQEGYAIVEDGVISDGTLDISDGYYQNSAGTELNVSYMLPALESDQYYTIKPYPCQISPETNQPLVEYRTSMSCDGDDGFYTSVIAADTGAITISGDGSVTTSFDSAVQQKVQVTQNGNDNLYTRSAEGVSAGLTAAPDETGITFTSIDEDAVLTLSASGTYNEVTFDPVGVGSDGLRLEEQDNTMILLDASGNELSSESIGNAFIFYTLGGTPLDAIENIPVGDTVSAPEDPERPGYLFEGWYSSPGYEEGTEWSFDTPIYDETRIYAKWVEDPDFFHTVTFRADGYDDYVIVVTDGETLAQEDIPAVPEQEGYLGIWEPADLSEISDDVIINAYYQPEGEEYPVEAYPMVQNTEGHPDSNPVCRNAYSPRKAHPFHCGGL